MQSNLQETNQIECPRCDGRGILQEFSHILNGRCFLCGGDKVINLKTKYSKKGLICKVGKGIVNQQHPLIPSRWVKKYRTCIVLSFDGGNSFRGVSSAPVVFGNDKNNPELEPLRNVWKWAKNAGAELIVED